MFQSLVNNQQPGLWIRVGYPSLKTLGSWFTDFCGRLEFIRNWVLNSVPSCYWISCFFFPQGFLTSVLQNYSRSNLVPVDILAFESVVIEYEDVDHFGPDQVTPELAAEVPQPGLVSAYRRLST